MFKKLTMRFSTVDRTSWASTHVQVMYWHDRDKVVKWTMYIGVDLHCKFTRLHDLRSKKHMENQASLFIVHADASNGRGHYKDWGGLSTFSWAKNWLFSFFRSNLWGWVLSATFVTSVKIYIVGGQMLIWSPGYLVQAWIHRIGWAGHYFHSCCCSGSIQCRWHCMKSL